MRPNKINDELARILTKRIVKALERARYYPAESVDTAAIAAGIVAPFVEKQQATNGG